MNITNALRLLFVFRLRFQGNLLHFSCDFTFLGVRKRVVSKRVVLADVPGYQKKNEGTFRCSPDTKNRTEKNSDVPQYQKPERGYIRQDRPFTKPPFCFLSTIDFSERPHFPKDPLGHWGEKKGGDQHWKSSLPTSTGLPYDPRIEAGTGTGSLLVEH